MRPLLPAPHGRRGRADDAGLGLVEVVVAMAAFSVVLAVFVRAVGIMTSTTARVRTTADAVTDARAATDLLERQLTPASATNTAVAVAGTWYLEFATDAVSAGTDRRCTQWRYRAAAGLLQYRTWSTVTLAPTDWTTVSDVVVNDPVTQPPFTVLPSDGSFTLPRVAVDLRLQGPGGSVVQAQGQYTLRNSLDAPPPGPDTVCRQLVRP